MLLSGLLTYHDMQLPDLMIVRIQITRFTWDERRIPPVMSDSENPGSFLVKGKLPQEQIYTINNSCHLKSMNKLVFIQSSYGDLCCLVITTLSHKFQRISFGVIESFSLICRNFSTLFYYTWDFSLLSSYTV